MSLHSGSRSLGQAVRLRDVRLGAVADVLLGPDARRVLGYLVECGDSVHRMLPFAAAELGPDGDIHVHSALVLMDEAFYRKRCRFLSGLVGTLVELSGEVAGRLVDLLFDADGSVRRFVVEGTEGDEEIPADDAVALLGGATASAV